MQLAVSQMELCPARSREWTEYRMNREHVRLCCKPINSIEQSFLLFENIWIRWRCHEVLDFGWDRSALGQPNVQRCKLHHSLFHRNA